MALKGLKGGNGTTWTSVPQEDHSGKHGADGTEGQRGWISESPNLLGDYLTCRDNEGSATILKTEGEVWSCMRGY